MCYDKTITYSTHRSGFPASGVLTAGQDSADWLAQEGQQGHEQQFTLDLGCIKTIDGVTLVNTRNGQAGNAGTQTFRFDCVYDIIMQC